MNTFNGKPEWKNIVAVILGGIGLYFLVQAWLYHMIVHLIVMPRDKWMNPFNPTNAPQQKVYPNGFCDILCNTEAVVIHQLKLMREGFGEEYCNEDR